MIKFKYKSDVKLFASLHPVLIMIFSDMWDYAYRNHGVSLVVTQTVSSKLIDQKLKRKSPAHSEHRAIDIRTKDLEPFVVQDIQNYINKKNAYLKYHYISMSGFSRLAYFHVGSAQHLHLAIHSKFAIQK